MFCQTQPMHIFNFNKYNRCIALFELNFLCRSLSILLCSYAFLTSALSGPSQIFSLSSLAQHNYTTPICSSCSFLLPIFPSLFSCATYPGARLRYHYARCRWRVMILSSALRSLNKIPSCNVSIVFVCTPLLYSKFEKFTFYSTL